MDVSNKRPLSEHDEKIINSVLNGNAIAHKSLWSRIPTNHKLIATWAAITTYALVACYINWTRGEIESMFIDIVCAGFAFYRLVKSCVSD